MALGLSGYLAGWGVHPRGGGLIKAETQSKYSTLTKECTCCRNQSISIQVLEVHSGKGMVSKEKFRKPFP